MLASAPAIAWEPTKPVEIVVAAGAGGASDQMARMMQAAIQKNNLMKQPMIVSLKGGASGAEALIYMKSSEGDPNKVLLAYSLIYMLPLSAKIPFNWRELTPVAVTALDQFVLWDNTTLPHKNVKEFVDAAKAASPPFKMGGTGSKREDQVLTVFMEKKTGAKFLYLPYKSGGEAATQLVGNHTQANVNNPSENLEVWRAGQVRALCVFDKERIAYKTKVTDTQSWNDIPTCKEEGLDVQYLMLRAIFLPGKVTPEQTAFYVDLLKKVSQTAEYKDYMEKQALKPIFLTGKDMLKFLEEDDKLNKQPDDRGGLRREVVGRCVAACASPGGRGDKRRAFRLRQGRWPHPTPKSSSTIRTRRRSISPPVVGTRTVDIVVYLLLLALAALLAYDNWRTGMGWAPDGPQAGYFPFYLSMMLAGASALWPGRRVLIARRGADETFVTRDQLRRVMQVFVPTLLFCLFTQWLGLYVASFLLIAGFMHFIGRIALWKSLLTAAVFSSPCSSPSTSPSTSSCRRGRSKRPSATRAARWKPSVSCSTASPSC